jgi:hypothetical protein
MKLKHLQRDRALLMTSILLVLMLGAGIFSGIVGFTLGHAALKGVTQPDIRLNNKAAADQNPKTRGAEILNEKDLVANAQTLMGIKSGADDKPDKFANKDKPTAVFPIEGKDQGIVMLVKSVKPEGLNLKLDAVLRNQGGQAAKFSQGVLTASDDQNKTIAVSSTGLPQTLAANGKDVVLKVIVPKTAVAKAKTITLHLTDADKKLGLDLANIPVEPTVKINIPDGQLDTVEDKEDQPKNQNADGNANQNTGTPQRARVNRSQPKVRAQSNLNSASQTKPPAKRSVKPNSSANPQN